MQFYREVSTLFPLKLKSETFICKLELSVILMKRSFLLLFLLLSSFVRAHEYFFSFAELEYKEMEGRLEATISVTSHDLEQYLQKKKLIKCELTAALKDSVTFLLISNELNNHFFVDLDPYGQNSTMDGVEFIRFTLDGYEDEYTGTIRFYLHANVNHPISATFGITFNLLMDAFKEQQNKLTFLFREEKSTFVFLQNNQKQFIDLD
jgi:hypothetical protein